MLQTIVEDWPCYLPYELRKVAGRWRAFAEEYALDSKGRLYLTGERMVDDCGLMFPELDQDLQPFDVVKLSLLSFEKPGTVKFVLHHRLAGRPVDVADWVAAE